jgi:SAM-dependent methyltransferase
MSNDTTSRAFFEHMYQNEVDPWKFASSNYEGERYAAIFKALRHSRYKHVFEPGCSIGVLTSHLASICGKVDAIDISPTAVERARARCSVLANVHIACSTLPHQIPSGMFDLVVLSEIGYYFEEERLREVLDILIGRMQTRGTLLAAHWLGSSPDHVLSGDRVHEIVGGIAGLIREHSELHSGFRLDRWVRQ